MNIAVISASLSEHSRSRHGAKLASKYLTQFGVSTSFYDLSQLSLEPYPRSKGNPDLKRYMDGVNSADAWVFAAPVYCWQPSGMTIDFLDYLIGRETPRYIPFVMLAGAGSEKSYLALAL